MAQTKKAAKGKTATKAKKAKEVDVISAKQFGRNVIVIVDGEKYSRAFVLKEDREEVLLAVESYNAKPTKKLKTSILNTMNELAKEKEVKEKKVAKAKKTLKKAPKVSKPTEVETTEEEIEKAKQLLKANNYVVSKSSPKRRSGEH